MLVIQYIVFTALKGYAMIIWVAVSWMKGEGDKCDLETVVSLVEVHAITKL